MMISPGKITSSTHPKIIEIVDVDGVRSFEIEIDAKIDADAIGNKIDSAEIFEIVVGTAHQTVNANKNRLSDLLIEDYDKFAFWIRMF